MTNVFASASGLAAAPLAAAFNGANPAICVAEAAQRLLPHLQRGQRIDAAALRAAMDSAFGGSDSEGAWDWKTAYDACEAATVLFLRKFGPAMRARAGSPAALLPMLEKIAGLLPTHTRRSQESLALQQFSTPIPLGLALSVAAAVTPADVVLEPSAGTGLLAIFAEFLAHRWRSTNLPRRVRHCWTISFSASASPASMPRRSTIISMPASRRASC